MGCCLSSNHKNPPPNTKPRSSSSSSSLHHSKQSRNPPPTHPLLLLEEETVKEVLSETPKPKKRSSQPISTFEEEKKKNHQKNDDVFKKPITTIFNPEDVSEISISNTTVTEHRETTTTNTTDDDVPEPRNMTSRNRNRSGELRREKGIGTSPARRSEPSPGRVRSTPGRESRGLTGNNGLRKDSGESSGRRSRSPAMRTAAAENGGGGGGSRTSIGRSPSARKTGKSPGRVRSELGDRNRKMEDNNGGKWPPPTSGNELLENPLVSLECFIFL